MCFTQGDSRGWQWVTMRLCRCLELWPALLKRTQRAPCRRLTQRVGHLVSPFGMQYLQAEAVHNQRANSLSAQRQMRSVAREHDAVLRCGAQWLINLGPRTAPRYASRRPRDSISVHRAGL